jgi:Uma2 family endonuclease
MNVALRRTMSVSEFLAWEERQELRYEFNGFRPVAMTGGTYAHDQITYNVRRALDARLAGKPCRPCGPNVKILAGRSVRYPDVLVTCSPISNDATVIDGPVVVFEVISKDSGRTDRIEKLRDYRETPSIRHYVILEQTSIAASVFARDGEDEDWIATALTEGDMLRLPELGIELPLAECYAGLDFLRDEAEPVAPAG